jgi:carboxymethylenebutenolidase
MPQERMKATDFPQDLLNLFDHYVHGEINRRQFLDGAQKYAVGGLTATAIWEALRPNYAMAQQVKPDDARLKTETVTVQSPQGNGNIKGYLARPASAGTSKLPSILVIHENRGLNPHIEDITRRLALANFMAFAPDGLTSVGGYPKAGDAAKNEEDATALFGKVDRPKMTEDFVVSAAYLKNRPDSSGKLGVVGFCFGGGIVNTLATRLGSDMAAGVPFYGAVPPDADIPKIKAAMLIHHGEADTRLAATWPAYHAALDAAKVTNEGFIYPKAQHGFNNDTTPRYDEMSAKLAWSRTIDWFNKYVRG